MDTVLNELTMLVTGGYIWIILKTALWTAMEWNVIFHTTLMG